MREYPKQTFGDMFEANAHSFAESPAVIMGDRELSHAALLGRMKKISSALERAGLRRQDRLALLSMNSIEFLEVLYAGFWSGIVVATVNFRLAPPEMAYIINNSQPRILIFEADYLPVIEQIRDQLKDIEKFICIGAETDWAEDFEKFVATGSDEGATFRSREEDMCLLLYTGGTTGLPKGCIWGQREFLYMARMLATEIRSACTSRIYLVMPLFHLGAMIMGLATLTRGGCSILSRQFDAGELLQAVDKQGATILHLAPTMFQMVIDHPDAKKIDWSSVDTLCYSAAVMPLPVLERGMEFLGDIFLNLYGQTEVASTSLPRSMHRPYGTEHEKRWLTSVGLPMPGNEVKIVDDDGNECPPETPGEIAIKSTAMARGYWNNNAASIETFLDGWCHTGDIGILDDEGILYLVDRKKDVVISGGENIYSREVEDAVLRHPAIAECAVIGVPDEKWGEAVCAVVVTKPGESAAADEVIETCKNWIASYKKPRHVVCLDELPKLPTGKINKVALRKIVAERGPN